MNPKILKSVIKSHEEQLIVIKETYNNLNQGPTKLLLNKIENMHSMFLYRVFSDIFEGFDTANSTQQTLKTLDYVLLGEGSLSFIEEESEHSKIMRERMLTRFPDSEIKPQLDRKLMIDYEGKSTYLDIDGLLDYIQESEIKHIKSINKTLEVFSLNNDKPLEKEGIKDDMNSWKEEIITFDNHNLKLLHPDLIKFFNIKG